jgi:hypothetical protein
MDKMLMALSCVNGAEITELKRLKNPPAGEQARLLKDVSAHACAGLSVSSDALCLNSRPG